MRGTFYCPAAAGDLHANVAAWRAVAAAGHELGNHTCFHPCRRRDGADWPQTAYDLKRYDRRRIVDELLLADRVLRLVDGQPQRSFAASCGHTTVGPDGAEESFVDDLRRCATIVRSGRAGVLPLRRPEFVVGSHAADAKTAAATITAIEPALQDGGWIVVIMHGVGTGTHSHFIAADEHLRLIDWIAAHNDRLWSAPVSSVAAALQPLA